MNTTCAARISMLALCSRSSAPLLGWPTSGCSLPPIHTTVSRSAIRGSMSHADAMFVRPPPQATNSGSFGRRSSRCRRSPAAVARRCRPANRCWVRSSRRPFLRRCVWRESVMPGRSSASYLLGRCEGCTPERRICMSAVLHALFADTPVRRIVTATLCVAVACAGLTTMQARSASAVIPPAGGGPILVVTDPANPFSEYLAEIMRAEGLNEFETADLSAVTSGMLAAYDVTVLGQMPLSPPRSSCSRVGSMGAATSSRCDPTRTSRACWGSPPRRDRSRTAT